MVYVYVLKEDLRNRGQKFQFYIKPISSMYTCSHMGYILTKTCYICMHIYAQCTYTIYVHLYAHIDMNIYIYTCTSHVHILTYTLSAFYKIDKPYLILDSYNMYSFRVGCRYGI